VKVITHRSRTTHCPRGVDLRNGSRQERERDNTPAKQQQNKALASKAQQD
jgi:hypothetical protein